MWQRKDANVLAAQQALLHPARRNNVTRRDELTRPASVDRRCVTKQMSISRSLLKFALLALVVANSVRCAAAVLDGSLSLAAALNQNLTMEGNQDWAVWGFADGGKSTSLAPDVRKSGGSGISDLTSLSNGNPLRGLGQFGAFAHTFTWSDGSATVSAVRALTGLQHDGEQSPRVSTVGEGFSFIVPADAVPRTLVFYVTTHLGIGRLAAILSDGGAAPYVGVLDALDRENAAGIVTIRYAANSAGQYLTVTFILVTANSPINSSNVAIQAASLAVVPDLPLSLAIEFSSQAQIRVFGPLGSTNRVDFCRDLRMTNWTPLTNVILEGTATFTFTDPGSTNDTQRFYRAVRLD